MFEISLLRGVGRKILVQLILILFRQESVCGFSVAVTAKPLN
jgi:hypothetical protein